MAARLLYDRSSVASYLAVSSTQLPAFCMSRPTPLTVSQPPASNAMTSAAMIQAYFMATSMQVIDFVDDGSDAELAGLALDPKDVALAVET